MNHFRLKLIFILGTILVSGFVSISFLSYAESKRNIHKIILEQNLPLSRDNIYSEIQRDMARPIFVSSLMAHDTFLKDWVMAGEIHPRKITDYLLEIKKKYSFSSVFFVSDTTRNYYHFSGLLKRISFSDTHDVWYYNFKAKNRPYDLIVDTNQAEKDHLTVFINHRLEGHDGKFLGVVGVGLDFNRISVLMADYQKRFKRNVFMVDPSGIIKAHRDLAKIQQKSLYDMPGICDIAMKALQSTQIPQYFEYNLDGRHFILTSRFVKELGWFLMVEQDETLALKSARKSLNRNILISALITLLTLLITAFTINYFQKRLEGMAMTDPLTRTFNRNEFEHRFKFMTEKNRRRINKMALILFDVDDLKHINDTHGHLAGDRIICGIAEIAAGIIRNQDLLVRWGGDEFIILVNAPLSEASPIAQRLKSAVADRNFALDGGKKIHTSISCGLAEHRPGQSLDDLLKAADNALYRAKNQGKNRVVIAG